MISSSISLFRGNTRKIAKRACLTACLCLLGAPASQAGPPGREEAVRLEADYILSCQYLDENSAAHGAINNVSGLPTWVAPGEAAMAIIGLALAADILQDVAYRERAQLAADYLVSVQGQEDGAWHDRYNFSTPETNARSARHTAQVLMAFGRLGYAAPRYETMKRGAQFLMSCQEVVHKGGRDDGLICSGKDAEGNYHTWRWASDNAYAYQALKTARSWAIIKGEEEFSLKTAAAAERILEGVNTVLRAEDASLWMRVVDQEGQPVEDTQYTDWISYAPLLLDLPVTEVDPMEIGAWIHERLQKPDGAVAWDDKYYPERRSPGYSFEASLVWLDTGQENYAYDAVHWAQDSGLWMRSKDEKGVQGGWVDWAEAWERAPFWQRFIDTSAYYIMIQNNGYDFTPASAADEASVTS